MKKQQKKPKKSSPTETTLNKWKFIKTNKPRDAYGETDYNKKIVRINIKRHKSTKVRRITKNPNGTESELTTMLHEINHVKHPNMGERGVEHLARAMKSHMGKKQKAKIYGKFK